MKVRDVIDRHDRFHALDSVTRHLQRAELRTLRRLLPAARRGGRRQLPKALATHVGGIYSSDVFYDERPDLNEQMVRHGILGVEMEAAELYNLAARYGRARAGRSDHLRPSTDRRSPAV